MNAEKIKEILDTVSFILVTPEFLGEERLKYVRRELQRIRNTIPILDEDGVAANIVGALLLAIVVFILIVMIFAIPPDRAFGSVALVWFYFTFTVMLLFFFAASILLAEKLAVRGRLFTIGACLFFFTRAIAVLHAGVPG
jgi:hypothetical protein